MGICRACENVFQCIKAWKIWFVWKPLLHGIVRFPLRWKQADANVRAYSLFIGGFTCARQSFQVKTFSGCSAACPFAPGPNEFGILIQLFIMISIWMNLPVYATMELEISRVIWASAIRNIANLLVVELQSVAGFKSLEWVEQSP
jgi:hypothetical protein